MSVMEQDASETPGTLEVIASFTISIPGPKEYNVRTMEEVRRKWENLFRSSPYMLTEEIIARGGVDSFTVNISEVVSGS